MKILYISQYFPPEVGATQNRAKEMAAYLTRLGHSVTVLTEFPNHPKGIIAPDWRHGWRRIEQVDGIRVIRVWVFARQRKNFFTRMGLYLSFMLNAALAGTLTAGRYDVVLATSPPYFVGVTGLWLSWFKRARFVYEVRDLWLWSAVELGELNNPAIIAWAEKLENLYYRKAAAIVTVTAGIYDEISAKGFADKLWLIYNGANCSMMYDRGHGKRREFGWSDRFIVLYAGIFGIAQGLEQIGPAIQQLQQCRDIQFVFIGEGPMKPNIRHMQAHLQLWNLTLLEEVAPEQIADYISAADCCLAPLKKRDIFNKALPSKVFDYMACARPVILGVDGEARRMLESAGAGVYVEPENNEALLQAVLSLRANPDLRRTMGLAGRAFVEKYFSRQQAAVKLEETLKTVCGV
jgi:glycosyltransferase involved in cell wall biosynthesis